MAYPFPSTPTGTYFCNGRQLQYRPRVRNTRVPATGNPYIFVVYTFRRSKMYWSPLVLLLLSAFVLVAANSQPDIKITTYFGYGCDWPRESRNYSFPLCFEYSNLRVTRIQRGQFLWEQYDDPRNCKSDTYNSTWVSLDTCTNEAVRNQYYKAQLPSSPTPDMNYYNISSKALVLFYRYNQDCNGVAAKKEWVTLNQCQADGSGWVHSWKGWRGTEPILTAEYWDSDTSCHGVNRGWAYLRNKVCVPIYFPSAYGSWMAIW